MARSTAPGGSLADALGTASEAIFESRIEERVGGAVDEIGTITIGPGNVLHFRSRPGACLEPAPDRQLRHGAAILDVDGGTGRFREACGKIASAFLLSETGELTSHLVGSVFVG